MVEDKFCWWTNHCEKHKRDYICCHFCPDKDKAGCEYPCADDLKTCKYRCDIPGDQAFKRQREKDLAAFYAEQEAKKQQTTQKKPDEPLHKISEVAKELGQVYDFVYNKVKSGEIAGVQVGSRYFISDKEHTRVIAKYKGDK